MKRALITIYFCLAVCTRCGMPSENSPANSMNIDFTPPSSTAVVGAFVFVVDGVNAEIFNQMLTAGELPSIQKYFVDRGLYVKKAVANIPSITLANLPSLATGKFPGHHGITGINWFDRQKLILRDYATIAQKNTLDGDYLETKNIFEYFPNQLTASLFFQPNRGATKFYENRLTAGPAFWIQDYKLVDRISLWRFNKLMKLARHKNKFPVMVYNYTLAPDFHAYKYGSDSKEYKQALLHIDKQIGRLLADVKRAGILNKIYIALVSDHSMGPVKYHFKMDNFLRATGLCLAEKKLWESSSQYTRKSYYAKFDAVACTCGDRYTALYLRKPNWKNFESASAISSASADQKSLKLNESKPFFDWSVRPNEQDLKCYPLYFQSGKKSSYKPRRSKNPFIIPSRNKTPIEKESKFFTGNLIQILRAQPAVDLIAWSAGKDKCKIANKIGIAEFSQPGGKLSDVTYTVLEGKDPLGYGVKAGKENSVTLSVRNWLAKTIDTKFPGIAAPMVAYFRAKRAGDIAIFASPGWDFKTVNLSGHGGVRGYDDLCVPILLAGPGVKKSQIKTAYTTDLPITLLKLLGKKIPPDSDGKVLPNCQNKSAK